MPGPAPGPVECHPRSGAYLHVPLYHIVGAMLENKSAGPAWPLACTDANAIFEHAGVYHVMHQTPERAHPPQHGLKDYRAAWGHVVSRDLVRWRRLPDALSPPAKGKHSYDSHDGDCDGWVSLPSESGLPTPLMTFGPDCARGLGSNDAPRVGLAWPKNASDPYLTEWVKDAANPVTFGKGRPCSFTGSVWRNGRSSSAASGANTTYSMICAVNSLKNAWGRYETHDPKLHGPWTLVDPSFTTWHGPGGATRSSLGSISAPSFVQLQPGATAGAAATPTHMINALGGRAFWLGRYDRSSQSLDVSGEMSFVESTDSPANWFVAGRAESDGRVLHVGFVAPTTPTSLADCYNWVPGGRVCPVTSIRELRLDATGQALVAMPVKEYATLRNRSLCSLKNVALKAGEARALPLPDGTGGEMDLEIVMRLPPPAATGPSPALAFGIDVLASPSSAAASHATRLSVNVTAPRADGTRIGNLSITPGRGEGKGYVVRSGWVMQPAESSLELRLLVDRSVVEAFVAGGRAVATARDYPAVEEVAARLWAAGAASESGAAGGALVQSAQAWSMGCGWEAPDE